MTTGGWEVVRTAVGRRIGEAAFDAWFRTLDGRLEGETLVLRCPDRFTRDWLRSRFGRVIEECAPDARAVEYRLDAGAVGAPPEAPRAAVLPELARDRLRAGAALRQLHLRSGQRARARGGARGRARRGGPLQSALPRRRNRHGQDAPVPRDPRARGQRGAVPLERGVHHRGHRGAARWPDAEDPPALPAPGEPLDPRRRPVPGRETRHAGRALPHARPPGRAREDGRVLGRPLSVGARRARPEAALADGLGPGRADRPARARDPPRDPARARGARRRARARGVHRAARRPRARLGARRARGAEPGGRARVAAAHGDHAGAGRPGARGGRAARAARARSTRS